MAKAARDPHLRLRIGLMLAILLLLLVTVLVGPTPADPPDLPPPSPLSASQLTPATVEQATRRDAGRGILVEQLRLRSPSSGRSFPIDVLLPPVLPPGAPLLLLFGEGGEEGSSWLRQGDLLESLGRLWAETGRALVVALPSTPPGKPTLTFRRQMEETHLALQKRYQLATDAASCHMDGWRRGGALALLLALERPDLYGRVGAALPEPGNINPYLIDVLRTKPEMGKIQIIHSGDAVSLQLEKELLAAGLGVEGLRLPDNATREDFGKKILAFHGSP
jgi:pimeloyl-ACP methyl ester carboxylesterase